MTKMIEVEWELKTNCCDDEINDEIIENIICELKNGHMHGQFDYDYDTKLDIDYELEDVIKDDDILEIAKSVCGHIATNDFVKWKHGKIEDDDMRDIISQARAQELDKNDMWQLLMYYSDDPTRANYYDVEWEFEDDIFEAINKAIE